MHATDSLAARKWNNGQSNAMSLSCRLSLASKRVNTNTNRHMNAVESASAQWSNGPTIDERITETNGQKANSDMRLGDEICCFDKYIIFIFEVGGDNRVGFHDQWRHLRANFVNCFPENHLITSTLFQSFIRYFIDCRIVIAVVIATRWVSNRCNKQWTRTQLALLVVIWLKLFDGRKKTRQTLDGEMAHIYTFLLLFFFSWLLTWSERGKNDDLWWARIWAEIAFVHLLAEFEIDCTQCDVTVGRAHQTNKKNNICCHSTNPRWICELFDCAGIDWWLAHECEYARARRSSDRVTQ